jgi:hypothetical protein
LKAVPADFKKEKHMTKIYLSGPMTGLPELNYPAFHAEAKRLRRLGYEVINPAELSHPGETRADCLRRDVLALVFCNTLALLPGWQDSAGAAMEICIARQTGMLIVRAADIVEIEG